MIRNTFLFFFFSVTVLTAIGQLPFKYDNTIYKAVYLNEAFRLMDSNKNYLLLDVRSPGEYADTSRSTALNIGRIKGAVNIDVDAVADHITELKKYIDQPVFVYCSHSQRSRRVSKLLAENGFQHVYNINGGMSLVNKSDVNSFPYKNKVVETTTTYTNIASADAIHLITTTPDLVVIDIRTEKEFASKDSLQQNNIGHLKNAINIPQDVFAEKFDSYNIPKNKPVLVYDLKGYNSMDLTKILTSKGFTRQYNLFEGFETLLSDHGLTADLRKQLFTDAPVYQMIDAKAGIDLLKRDPDLIILDTRPTDQFENKSATSYMNLGRLKGAVSVQTLESLEKIIQQKNKSAQFLVYGSAVDFSTIICQALVKNGFQHVSFLRRNFYDFVWSTFNIENCKIGKEFLANHEGLY